MEISEEMEEALRILRSDKRIEAYNQMTESHKNLVQRLDERDKADAEWRVKWEAKQGSPEPVTDPAPEPDPSIPPPPAIEPPADPKPKKKSRWWGDNLDD